MNIPKHRFIGISAMFLLSVIMATMMSLSVFATELPTATATISVEKESSFGAYSEEMYTFTLTPDDASYPMPDEADGAIVTIKDGGTASFGEITYSEPSTYKYTVKETFAGMADSTLEMQVYNVTVFVTTDDNGNLTSKVVVTQLGADGKAENAVFAKKTKRTPPETDGTSEGSDNPQTGDTGNLTPWIIIAISSAGAMVILLIAATRKKETYQQL